MRLPVSGEISGLSWMRDRCDDSDWKLVSKWNGAAVDTRMKSVVTAQIACAMRNRSPIMQSAHETPPDGRGFAGHKSTHQGIFAAGYRTWYASSIHNGRGHQELDLRRSASTAPEGDLRFRTPRPTQ